MQNIRVTDERSAVNIPYVQQLLANSYWGHKRDAETVQRFIETSDCFSAFENGKQIGFARVVSDHVTFAYLADVIVDPDYRGRGVGKVLMKSLISHPQYNGIDRWILATRDAHELYKQYGFTSLEKPDRYMEKRK